jgi:hypothetical protein
MLETLKEKFTTRYSKYLSDLDNNMYNASFSEGGFLVPTIRMTGNPINNIDNASGAAKLINTGEINVVLQKVKPIILCSRFSIPEFEIEVALKDERYFNHLLDSSLNLVLTELANKIGKPSELRWGMHYFKYMGIHENDGRYYFQFSTKIASKELMNG